MAFVDRSEAGRAVDFAGRGMEEAPYPRLQRTLKHVERARDVGRHITVRRLVGVRNGDQRGKMEYHVDFARNLAREIWIANIAADDFDAIQAADILEPAPVVE